MADATPAEKNIARPSRFRLYLLLAILLLVLFVGVIWPWYRMARLERVWHSPATGHFEFVDTSLDDATVELSRAYGFPVVCDESLMTAGIPPVCGVFPEYDLRMSITWLARLSGARYVVSPGEIRFFAGNRPWLYSIKIRPADSWYRKVVRYWVYVVEGL